MSNELKALSVTAKATKSLDGAAAQASGVVVNTSGK